MRTDSADVGSDSLTYAVGVGCGVGSGVGVGVGGAVGVDATGVNVGEEDGSLLVLETSAGLHDVKNISNISNSNVIFFMILPA